MDPIIRKVEVQPVQVSTLCPCTKLGSPLRYVGSMAGIKPRFGYTCTVCHAAHWLDHEAVRIEYIEKG